ncbi:hypothetical protein C882_3372 [Caenispirillum salinarum AK4]|uniref:Peptidoglycan binding-like domain-containing protein n=1 Tax=Caenispirillum salinarum AK4 TaxID=1238182 RepID=K9GLM8_9PROT|nr:DUF4384 domain-containing protein [Caenispirillum salinarum]EKV25957.1 hypothetical protein C882_3372 [Caenispirillum salinarum AK4]
MTRTTRFRPRRRPSSVRAARLAGAAAIALLAGGCMTPPEQASIIRQPSTAPTRTISSFTESLRCMDELLWTHGKRDIYITSNGIPDATGRLLGGTKDMLITAVSRMSDRSGAFDFVDFEPGMDSVNALHSLIGIRPEFRAPSYYVRGAVTQLDENVIADAASAGLSLPALDLGVSQDQLVSVISIDLSIGELVTRRILPGTSTSNSIAVVSYGQGANAGGEIRKAGLSFSLSFNRSEGMHQALRTLIELSAIEVLGKLTQVPYWQCLGIDSTNPAYMGQARSWYDGMSPSDRVIFAQRVLSGAGYAVPVGGTLDQATRDALGRFQASNDLIPSGTVDFDTYLRMLSLPQASGGTVAVAAAAPPSPATVTAPAPPPASTGPDVVLDSNRGPAPRYRTGETMEVSARLTEAGFLYCYYADASGTVARIFPNRFQPDAFVQAGQRVTIPPGSAEKPFVIRMDQPGNRETIACIAAEQEAGVALPDALKAEDLQPIPGATVDAIVDAFRTASGSPVRARTMPITVTGG